MIADQFITLTKDELIEIADEERRVGYLEGITDSMNKQKKKKDYLEVQESKNKFHKELESLCGKFYFSFYDEVLDKTTPQNLVRFMYLCTYLRYKDNRLMKDSLNNSKTPIYTNELGKYLRLERRETYNTINALVDAQLIRINEDNTISVNRKICKKDKVVNIKRVDIIRVFDNGIRHIYEKSNAREHKKIALLFKMLPYINLQWNIVCYNTDEQVLECIKPLEIKELAKCLDQKNITNFKKYILGLTIGNESVCMLNMIGSEQKTFITINPKIYYAGTREYELKYLSNLFKVLDNNEY